MPEIFFRYIEKKSILHSINPSIKLIAVLIMFVAVTLVMDPITSLVFLFLIILSTRFLANLKFREIATALILSISTAVFIAIFNILFYKTNFVPELPAVFKIAGLKITDAALKIGLSRGIRVFSLINLSIIFVSTTDVTALVDSLVQNMKIPYRIAYGTLVAYRMIPLLSDEFSQIQASQKIRGILPKKNIKSKIEFFFKQAITLMVGAIRRSDRLALAMDSKAFGAFKKRSFYRPKKIKFKDVVFLITTVFVILITYYIMWKIGFLKKLGILA